MNFYILCHLQLNRKGLGHKERLVEIAETSLLLERPLVCSFQPFERNYAKIHEGKVAIGTFSLFKILIRVSDQ